VVALEGLAWSRQLPLVASSVIATLAAYVSFTVMHEATHGNIHGRHRPLSKLGTAMGWLASVPLFAPYPAFRVLHLRHHSHTNDPDQDPDYFVAGPLGWALGKGLFTIGFYYAEFLFGATARSTSGRRERSRVLIGLGVYVAAAAALVGLGYWQEVVALWLGPAVVASVALAFFFDWLPHHPHQSRERYRDTRAFDVRVLDWPLLGQNLHLVHHLFPRVPFYLYRTVFDAGRARFEEKGSTIRGGRRRDLASAKS